LTSRKPQDKMHLPCLKNVVGGERGTEGGSRENKGRSVTIRGKGSRTESPMGGVKRRKGEKRRARAPDEEKTEDEQRDWQQQSHIKRGASTVP